MLCAVELCFAFWFRLFSFGGHQSRTGGAVSDGEEEEEDVHGVVLLLRARV